MLLFLNSSQPKPTLKSSIALTAKPSKQMKTIALLAFFFFFLALFAITTAEVVFDSEGELLRNGGNYYLLPPGLGGKTIEGAGVDHKSDGSCSLAVVLKLTYKKGWLTNIASLYRTLHITTNYPIYISFTQLPLGTCTKNSQWLITRVIGFGEPVMVGAANEFPTPLSGWFHIKPYDSAKFHYKLVFCYAQDDCGHVGVKTDSHGNRRLVVTEDEQVEPLVIKFVKEATASGLSMVV